MSVPTEPGWYWWRDIFGNWVAVEVYLSASGLRAWAPHCEPVREAPLLPWISQKPCEWGPRIPGPARLAAMEELAQINPWRRLQDYEEGAPPLAESICQTCVLCEAERHGLHGDYDRSDDHSEDCPWLRAQREGEQP